MCLTLSDSGVAELFAAYAKAQADMGDVKKGAENAAFKQGAKVSRYADLASVVEAIRPALNAHGLAVVQFPGFDGEKVSVETLVTHSAGGWMRSTLHLRPTKSDPQGVGSAITYGRRYALLSVAGVAPEDDDGNAASGEGDGGQRFSQRQEPRREEPSDAGAVRAFFLAIDSADGAQALEAWKDAHKSEIEKLTPRGQTAVRDHYTATMKALRPKSTPFDTADREAA